MQIDVVPIEIDETDAMLRRWRVHATIVLGVHRHMVIARVLEVGVLMCVELDDQRVGNTGVTETSVAVTTSESLECMKTRMCEVVHLARKYGYRDGVRLRWACICAAKIQNPKESSMVMLSGFTISTLSQKSRLHLT